MPTYTINELIEKMEPQARRDKALIGRCVAGLGLYAAHIAESDPHSQKIEDLRKLAESLVWYWGLNDSTSDDDAKPLTEFLDAFDYRVNEAKTGGKIEGDVYQTAHNVIYGLYRYGEDMVVGQGRDAMNDILDMSVLIKEISSAWDFEFDVQSDLTARLEAEVREMLAGIQLPGELVNGVENIGYTIQQAVMFDNDRGFALGHNPKAVSPYVTWQFTNENGTLDYYWGKYYGSEDRAKIDYIDRVTDYTNNYPALKKVTMPETENRAEVTESGAIPVEVMSESQPLVTVTFSEHDGLRGVEKMPLYLANTAFFEADEKHMKDYIESGRKIAPYMKTDFRIDFTINGKPESYEGRYDIGSGDQTIIDHISDVADFHRNDGGMQQYYEEKGADELEAVNARYDFIINDLIPFFEKHCDISRNEAWALSELMTIYDKAGGRPSETDVPRIAYLESIVEHSWKCRQALNTTGLDNLPEAPAPFREAAKNTAARISGEKPSVMDEIKAAQKAQREQPQKSNPMLGKNKKNTEPEL